jgi:enediyne biosynthesis protein E4
MNRWAFISSAFVFCSLSANNHRSAIQFLDVAEKAGLDFRQVSGSPEKKYIPETMGGGVAWIDYNRDGWPDLYLVNGGHWEDLSTGRRSVSNALYRNNRDGTFTNVTREAGLEGKRWGMGATVGDYNNDSWPDLYVCNFGPSTLYRNNGDGTFTDVTGLAGVGDDHWSSSAAFGDYDGDGWLDLYLVNYVDFDIKHPSEPDCQYRGIKVHCGPKGFLPAADVLYHNNHDGTFTDVSKKSGIGDVTPSYGLGVIWGDYDNDGDLDLFVANDSMANFLFQNQGDGTFREVGVLSGTAYNEDGKAQAGMGVTMGDYDHDGLFDFYVTHFSDDYGMLYRNMGHGIFRDVSYSADVAFPSWKFLGWGTSFLDFDNDGWEDLFVATGHVYPQVDNFPIDITFAERKLLFKNLANGKFKEVGTTLGNGLTERWSSRGAAFADFDNDGDIDVAVNNMDSRPSLLRNDGGNHSGHWLLLGMEGVQTNRSAIGVRVTVETQTGRQMQEVHGGSSYQATNDLRLHFGLGAEPKIKKLLIRWTTGKIQTFDNVEADKIYSLREGEQLVVIR